MIMEKIIFYGIPERMNSQITNVPGFEGDVFRLNFPESIGSSHNSLWFRDVTNTWEELEEGKWLGSGFKEGILEYTIHVNVHEDHVDFIMKLTNLSEDTWPETMAFNCFNNGSATSIRDHECKRHWVRTNGEFKKLIEVPRVFGPRPALQLYSVEGAPPGKEIPFVERFKSTPENVTIEGWMAIRSRDDKHMVAVVAKPALYTFQNREYSCIHSAPSFGALGPGETGTAFSRVYFVEATLEEWYDRMVSEMDQIDLNKL